VLFVIGALAGGWLVGAALGGSLRRLEQLRLRRVALVAGAVVVQLLATLTLRGGWYVLALIVSLALACAFVALNPALPGRGLIVGGLACNALVIAANGAMPVAAGAARRAGVSLQAVAGDPRHRLLGAHTHLSWLADRIPLALPWQPQVLSVGDVLVAAGVGLLVAAGMLRGTHHAPSVPVRQPPADLELLVR